MVSRIRYSSSIFNLPSLTISPATLDDLDDPINNTSTSDRAPLTGNITSSQANSNSRTAHNAQGYLNSAIPGEDRRAPVSTLDETVWETLRRDLLAVWEKMRQVLWPKYLLGGMLNQGGGMGGAERGEGDSLAGGVPSMGQLRGIVGRWPDADAVLQGGMSEGLRDWDLWYVMAAVGLDRSRKVLTSSLLTILLGDRCSSACFCPSSSRSTLATTSARSSSAASSP